MTCEKRGKYTDKHTLVFRMNNMYSKEIEKGCDVDENSTERARRIKKSINT